MWAGAVIPVILIILIFLFSHARIELYRTDTLTVTLVLPLLSYEFKGGGTKPPTEPSVPRIRRARKTLSQLTPIRHTILYILKKSDVSYTKFAAEMPASLGAAVNSVILEASILAFIGAFSRTVSAVRAESHYGLKYKICVKTRILFLFNSLFIFLYYTTKGFLKKRVGSIG